MFTRNNGPAVLGTTIRTGGRNVYRPVLLNGPSHLGHITDQLGLSLSGVRVMSVHTSGRRNHHTGFTGRLTRGHTHRNCDFRRTCSGVCRHGCFNVSVIRRNSTSTFVANLCAGCDGAVGITGSIVNVHSRCGAFKAVRVLGARGNMCCVTSALVGHRPSRSILASVTGLSTKAIGFFGRRPMVTVLDCSGFNASTVNSPMGMGGTMTRVRGRFPSLTVSNRVRMGCTLGGSLHSRGCPFSHLGNGSIGALMFPGLDDTGNTCGLLRNLGPRTRVVNPVRVKLGGPVRFASSRDDMRSVMGVATMTMVSTCIRGVGGRGWFLFRERVYLLPCLERRLIGTPTFFITMIFLLCL